MFFLGLSTKPLGLKCLFDHHDLDRCRSDVMKKNPRFGRHKNGWTCLDVSDSNCSRPSDSFRCNYTTILPLCVLLWMSANNHIICVLEIFLVQIFQNFVSPWYFPTIPSTDYHYVYRKPICFTHLQKCPTVFSFHSVKEAESREVLIREKKNFPEELKKWLTSATITV